MITAVIFQETGVVRLFNSYNLAQAVFPNCEHRFFNRPSELAAKLGPQKLRLNYERVLAWCLDRSDRKVGPTVTHWHWPVPVDWSDADIANELWRLATMCGDLTKGTNTLSAPEDGKMKIVPGYVIELSIAKQLFDDWANKLESIPKQAAMIAKWFADEGYDFYTKDEMVKCTGKVSFIMAISTKQDPWRIMRYYTPLLERYGVIKERG